MASKSQEDLLQEISTAIPVGGIPSLTTATGVRSILTSIVNELGNLQAASTSPAPVVQLPKPQLQIRQGRIDTGDIPTANRVRVCFDAPLSPEILAANPEIWLFTYNQRRSGRRRCISWGHPSHQNGQRAVGGYWGGSGEFKRDTEFYNSVLQETLTMSLPYADLAIDGNQWFHPVESGISRAKGKKGSNYRFRFALVIDAPEDQPTATGKMISELSDEIWFGHDKGNNYFHFRLNSYNKAYMNQNTKMASN